VVTVAIGYDAGVVPRGEVIGAEFKSAMQQQAEFEVAIAGNTRIRGSASCVLLAEVINHGSLELLLHVEDVVWYVQLSTDPAGILGAIQGAATGTGPLAFVVFRTVQAQSDAHRSVTLLLEEEGCDRGVHPAAHGDENRVSIPGVHVFD